MIFLQTKGLSFISSVQILANVCLLILSCCRNLICAVLEGKKTSFKNYLIKYFHTT